MAWKRALLSAGILVMGLVLVSGGNRRQNDQDSGDRVAMKEIGNSNFKFSHALYKELAKNPGNVFFSPLSIHSILTMLSLGAKGDTLTQLTEGLELPEPEVAKNGYRNLNKNLKFTADKGVTVNIANKIYATKKSTLRPAFKSTTRDFFNAEAENVDFGQSEKVRKDINKWVESHTHNKIKDVVPSGLLSTDTAMVLVNAVYFKGRWLTEFDPANSTDGNFNGVSGPERIRFMEATSEFSYKYSRKLNARTVELAYNGDKMSMVIIMPFKREEFNTMERLLATTDSKDYLPGQYDKYNVRVKIPKFKIEKETPLAGPLEELGMTDMFSNNADLSELVNGGPRLKVSKVLHKAFVEVNEEGSEAAATTVLAVQTLSLNSDDNLPIDFIADQPFIFMIRHKPSNSILFMGRYSNGGSEAGVEASNSSQPPRRTQSRVRQPPQPFRQGTGANPGNRGAGVQQPESETPVNVRNGAGGGTGGQGNIEFVNEQNNNYDLHDS